MTRQDRSVNVRDSVSSRKTPSAAAGLPRPDGIRDEHVRPSWLFGHRASPLSLIVLTGLMVLGLSGRAGGGPSHAQAVRNAHGVFELLAPSISRDGNVIEQQIRVQAIGRIDKLVIGVDPQLWHQITTNSTVPQAAEESFSKGLIRFAFDTVDAGTSFQFQVSQQINPALIGTNRGRIAFFDGERLLAELPVRLTVLP